MKPFLFLLPLLAVFPLGVSAQGLAPSPAFTAKESLVIEPAARALLERAVGTYQGATTLSFSLTQTINDREWDPTLVRYSGPRLLRIDRRTGPKDLKILSDDSDYYTAGRGEYRKMEWPAPVDPLQFGIAGSAGRLMGLMMAGRNPVDARMEEFAKQQYRELESRTVALGPRVVDGELLSGIRWTYSYLEPGKKSVIWTETTLWFGGARPTLRRVQELITGRGRPDIHRERVVEQQLAPVFAPELFVFDATGLRLVSDEEAEQAFDPRLQVGAEPLPFVAKDLQGRPIALEQYRGKVLLLDFWATWCGPCLEALPELKSVYAQYHSEGLEVVGITADEDREKLDAFLKAEQLPWPQSFEGKGLRSSVPLAYGVRTVPLVLVIGRDGKIAAVNPEGKLEAVVKAALG